jgi:sec-independent protein translocase protein TatC
VQQDTFISHLIELRSRLMHALGAVLAAFVVLFLWPGSGAIYDFLAAPLMHALPEGTKMIATGVITPFMVPMKVTAMVAFFLALPYVLYQAWAFVAPGLYDHEKKFAVPLIFASTALFLVGVAFCYYFVFGTVFNSSTISRPSRSRRRRISRPIFRSSSRCSWLSG